MRDVLAPDSTRWRAFQAVFSRIATAAGYGEIIVPMLEDLEVFKRVGETTEVVTKEMYDFVDKGNRHVALRPEQTASVCRAFVQHRPAIPWKTFYSGPNFRYERPQRGRFRQFDQVGIEALGADDPFLDAEVIAIGWQFFQQLGLRQVTLLLNSLGEPTDRGAYVAALKDYFEANLDRLSDESKLTLTRNPLRVLDSKRSQDIDVIDAAPAIGEFYSAAAAAHFAQVQHGLRALDIPFTLEPRLVRGLDYYRHTTFEYVGGTLGSAQNALGGGGRYDGLVEALGGPQIAGVGLALGLDRTLLACDDEGVFAAPVDSPDVFVVDTTGGLHALLLTQQLQRHDMRAERAYENRSIKSQMKAADRSGATVAVIIGSDEVASGTVTLKLLADGTQSKVASGDLVEAIRKHLL
jgi:histidyl-tRNA synthetase